LTVASAVAGVAVLLKAEAPADLVVVVQVVQTIPLAGVAEAALKTMEPIKSISPVLVMEMVR
ncbi:hypothetical protein R0K17_26825, partial [Planococcus sp. SIMBA_143]